MARRKAKEADLPATPYEPTKAEKEALERASKRAVSNIRLKVKSTGAGTATLGIDHKDLTIGVLTLMDALGVSRCEFAYELMEQISNVATKGQEVKEAPVNAMLAGIVGMKPRDEAEAMLIAQMVATHNLSMTFARRLNHVENIPQQDSAVNALTKLTRTYAAQLAALKQYRTGGEQRVIVQRVDVRDGGQAVVGVVNPAQGGGDPAKNEGQSHAQRQIADARGSSMLCDVQKEPEALPGASGPGPVDMSDARRNKSRRSGR